MAACTISLGQEGIDSMNSTPDKKSGRKTRSERGENIRDIVTSLARSFPRRDSRQSFLEASHAAGAKRRGAARSLGALMTTRRTRGKEKQAQIGEALYLNGQLVGLG